MESQLKTSGAESSVTFTLNEEVCKVSSIGVGTSLLTYIRDVAQLKGTKFMCREGGCGACIVNLTFTDPVTGIDKSVSVNSCLFPVYACHGMSVTTVEGIGSRQKGYHPVQTRLARFYGTQCGFCTPGWVMAMYSLLKTKRKLTMNEIEQSFGSNNCRCTGYRSILEAFKTFADDRCDNVTKVQTDIEDFRMCNGNPNGCGDKCKHQKCATNRSNEDLDLEDIHMHFLEVALSSPSLKINPIGSSSWYRVSSVQEIFQIFTMIKGTYMLVAGNTAQCIFENKYPPPPQTYIDINGVAELKSHRFAGKGLHMGANTTLTETINLFDAVSEEQPVAFGYLMALADHIRKVAHVPVRNVGTIAGNLSTKHYYPRFPSDLFTIFETVGAHLIIDSGNGARESISLPEYLRRNMYKKIIVQIVFQPLDLTYVVKTYKVMRRAQNDHAVVNAGFCFSFDRSNNYNVLRRPSIVLGGIRPDFIHASKTESFLTGKRLLNQNTLQKALALLDSEVFPDRKLPEASIEYRKGLVFSLFYRYMLSLNPSAVNSKYRSGGEEITRPLSYGIQEYTSDPQQYPLTQPLPKLESLIQCSGEVEYTNDLSTSTTELYAALVLTDCGPATLARVDASNALKIPGVIRFFSAKDIPGENNYITPFPDYLTETELLFVEDKISYAGQVVGMVVATTQDLADFAASRVVLEYADVKKPLLYVQDVLKQGQKDRIKFVASIDPVETKADVEHVIVGSFSFKGGQYHYHYETQTCSVTPRDNNNLDVVVSAQWVQGVQESIAQVLNISNNRVNVATRRCGGAYGAKIARHLLSASACGLASYLLQRPVRIVLTMETNMRAIGGRYLNYIEYEVGVNNEGTIQYLKSNYYNDKGFSLNETETAGTVLTGFYNFYDASTWNVKFYDVLTDKTTTVATRAPGFLGGISTIEHIMEHIAWTVQKDPLEVRLNNIGDGLPIPRLLEEIKEKSDFEKRLQECRTFNSLNQWKKHGLSIVPMKYTISPIGVMHVLLSIYRADGTVAITTGAIEIGQGVNTKVAQVAAHELNIPLSYIQLKQSNNLTSPNNISTSGSMSTDFVCTAVSKCCQQINERLLEVRKTMSEDVSWSDLIEQAYILNVNLNATYMAKAEVDLPPTYTIFGVTALEVEIDCLTGEHRVVRVDILQNVGQSLNPFIDIGQIEGAFLMGLGHFTSEELIFDPNTGLLTTDRTWEYKVPGAKDIPEDWRVYFTKDPDSPPAGFYGSKSISECPLVLSVSVLFAIRRAIESLRRDIGLPKSFFNNDPPCTTENIFLRCNTSLKDYCL